MSKRNFTTKILHAKFLKEDAHGSLRMPVYDNVAFEFKTTQELEQAFQGKISAHAYSRISNPTTEHFEGQLKAVTDSVGVLALSSGMAAISNTVLTLAKTGDNIITSRHLFGNTYSLFELSLKEWGLETRYADLTNPREVAPLIDDKTKIVFFETITNPQLEVVDIQALSAVVRPAGIILVADTTLTPPYLFEAKKFGVDIEVVSSTKWMSGGATSVGGVIIDYGTFDYRKNDKLKNDAAKLGPFTFINRLRREVYRNIGSCLSAHNAYLQSLGLETMAMRIDVSCANALAVAEFLEKEPLVKAVGYPGLKSFPYYNTAFKQFGPRPGSLLTFDLGSKEECFKFVNGLKLICRATNLQDNRSLIIHPSSTIFCEYTPLQKEQMGIRETMLRLSLGIEDADDLMSDIRQSLEALS